MKDHTTLFMQVSQPTQTCASWDSEGGVVPLVRTAALNTVVELFGMSQSVLLLEEVCHGAELRLQKPLVIPSVLSAPGLVIRCPSAGPAATPLPHHYGLQRSETVSPMTPLCHWKSDNDRRLETPISPFLCHAPPPKLPKSPFIRSHPPQDSQ